MSAATVERRVGGNFARPDGRPRRGGRAQKYFLTPDAAELIRTTYQGHNRRAIARRLGVPDWQVSKWAGELGVRRTKEKPWTEADVAYLRAHVAKRGWRALAKHLGRTVVAVKLKAKRLDLHKLWDGGWTQRQIAGLLGVDDHRVHRWIERGWLSATRRQTDRVAEQGGDAWRIAPDDLRPFLRDHPEVLDLRRVDRDWLLELLLGPCEWKGELVSCRHCGEAFFTRSETGGPQACAGCASREWARRRRHELPETRA